MKRPKWDFRLKWLKSVEKFWAARLLTDHGLTWEDLEVDSNSAAPLGKH